MNGASSQRGEAVWTAFAVSVAVHLAVVASLIPVLRPEVEANATDEEAETEEPERLSVQVVSEPEESEPEQPEARRKRDPENKRKERREEEKRKEKEQQEDRKQPQRSYNRKAVVQETNETSPEEAEFVSQKANKTDEETRARETSKEFVKPSKTSSKKKREAKESEESPEEKLGSKAVASKKQPRPSPRRRRPQRSRQRQESQPESERRPVEEAPDEKGPKPSKEQKQQTERESEQSRDVPRRPLPLPRPSDYDKVFDEEADRRRRKRHAEKGVGHDMYKRIENSKGSVKAAMENYIPEVQPGNHTSVNAHADKAATYVNRIHSKIHPRWGGRYLPHLDTTYGPGHKLSDPNLNTVLEFVVDGKTGALEKVTIVSSSGITSYDMEAVLIAQHVAPHPKPPEEIVSPDGNVYMHWNFWRDQRQCGTFGVDVYKVNADGSKEGASSGVGDDAVRSGGGAK